MNTQQKFHKPTLGGALLAVAFVWTMMATAARAEHLVVPLSDPAKPAELEVSLVMGGIKVTGGATKEVVVEAVSRAEDEGDDLARPQGVERRQQQSRQQCCCQSQQQHRPRVAPGRPPLRRLGKEHQADAQRDEQVHLAQRDDRRIGLGRGVAEDAADDDGVGVGHDGEGQQAQQGVGRVAPTDDPRRRGRGRSADCLLYTSDAADE